MNEIYELKELLMKELEEYGRKGVLESAGSLEIIDKLAHAIKNICKIIESAEDEGGQSSYDMGSPYNRSSRASSRAARRRDSMGRYSRDGRSSYRQGSSRYEGSSYGNSYGGEMEDMVESIRGMMQELPPEVQRDAQRFVQKLEEQM